MVRRGIRRDRSAARAQPARLGAALALIVGLAPAAGAQDASSSGEPFEFLADEDMRKLALDAWRTGDPDALARFAFSASSDLRYQGLEREGIDLLDIVLPKAASSEYGPALLAMRGDLKRAAGLFDGALADLAAAEQGVSAEGATHRDFVLHYVHGFRTQVWLDTGILHLADTEIALEHEVTRVLAEATRAGGDPAAAATYELSSAYRAASLEVARGEHRRAAERMAELLSGDSLEAIPSYAKGVELRHGQHLLMAARDEAVAGAGVGVKETTPTLLESRLALESSLEGELFPEEEIEARLCLADVGWLTGDTSLERRELRALHELCAREPQAFPAEEQARLAAFAARRLLAQADAGESDLRLALEDLEEAFARVESEWLAASRRPAGLGFLNYPEQRLVVETWARLLIEVHGSEEGPREALAVLARAQAIGTLTLRVNGGALVSRELLDPHLAALPDGAGILAWLPGMDSSFVLAADREQVEFVPLPAGAILEERGGVLARRVRRYPSAPRAALVAKDAGALAEVLLPPGIARRVEGWQRVLLVGSELFGSPALEPLPLGDGTLGDRLATSYLPSIPLAEILRRRSPPPRGGKDVAFLAATAVGEKPIELSREETARLEQLIGPPGPMRLLETGPGARIEALGAARDMEVLAILGHGRYDPLRERPASIELVDGRLGCEELERLELPRLVCLLTCGAGRAPQVIGDAGTAHLGGAALVGGAEAVLLADTEIEVAATLALFEVFLGRLRAGDAPDEALRQARLAVAKQDARWSDPFFACGLRLFGWGGYSPASDR